MLEDARRLAGNRLTVLSDEAIDLRLDRDGVRLELLSGKIVAADSVIIAPGNLPPHGLPALAGLHRPAYADDPSAADLAEGLTDTDSILLLGSGLTAVDCALSLDSAGFKGRIIALSRRGLAPQSHAPTPPFASCRERPQGSLSMRVRSVRRRADEIGWRNAVDELRPFTPDMWRAASLAERERFLRHLRPYWDVHRHRIAPPVASRLKAMQEQGRLDIRAAKIKTASLQNGAIAVDIGDRGKEGTERLTVARVVNCTGPLGDLRRTSDPLLQNLFLRGAIRPDQLTIGIDVDQQCRAIARSGSAQNRLFVVGPMTRGAHWEIVAVPDIRRQVWTLARHITGAHWVEAEGL